MNLDIFAADMTVYDDLLEEIKQVIRHGDASRPRSQQKALGPSQIGHPCPRNLAMGLMEEPAVRDNDPWMAIVGTATHAWFSDALKRWNEKQGKVIWIPDQRVLLRPGLSGEADAYHVPSASVVDLKVPGVTTVKQAVKAGEPSIVYKRQVQGYGYGYRKLGFPVKHVVVVMMPRSGRLEGHIPGLAPFVWGEPYDEQVALDVMTRLDEVTMLCHDLDVEHHPERYSLIPAQPYACEFCDWHSTTPRDTPWCAGVDTDERRSA